MNLRNSFGQIDGLYLVNLLLDDPFLLHDVLDLFLKLLLLFASVVIVDFQFV